MSTAPLDVPTKPTERYRLSHYYPSGDQTYAYCGFKRQIPRHQMVRYPRHEVCVVCAEAARAAGYNV